jgi:hypothetical protein
MLKEHKLNHQESMKLRDKMEHILVSKECYTNIFHAIMHSDGKFTNGEWKIAYGYLNVLDGESIMARHCFIVNSEGEAIDPTLMNISGYQEGQDRGHVSFAVFENTSEYLDAVSANDNFPDLIKRFRRLENQESEKWAQENGRVLIR